MDWAAKPNFDQYRAFRGIRSQDLEASIGKDELNEFKEQRVLLNDKNSLGGSVVGLSHTKVTFTRSAGECGLFRMLGPGKNLSATKIDVDNPLGGNDIQLSKLITNLVSQLLRCDAVVCGGGTFTGAGRTNERKARTGGHAGAICGNSIV
jgi:hypothetical protein